MRYKNLKMDAQLLCLLIIIVDIVYIYGTHMVNVVYEIWNIGKYTNTFFNWNTFLELWLTIMWKQEGGTVV